MAMDNRTQVIVIGAGMSGLTAASELHFQGIDVIVLEASAKVGGRVHSADTSLGSHLDLGGQWIGRGHDRITALVKRAQGTIYPMFSRGLPIVVCKDRVVPLFSPSILLAGIYVAILDLATRIYVPRRFINVTVEKVITTLVPLETTRKLLRLGVAITSTAELSMFSLYSYARSISLTGGLFTMLRSNGGAQDSWVTESMGIVPSMLAAELLEKVLTDMPVVSVSQNGIDDVTVRTASGRQFHARRVICTVPPPMLKTITFTPRLPAERRALQRNTRMGVVYKAIAAFERPFWRDGALGGEFVVLDDPAFGVFDSSPPHGPGHLCLLVAGTPARQLDNLGPDGRRQMLLSRLVPHLGDRVLQPVDWHEKAWHLDEYCGGGYLAFAIAGTTEGLLPMPHEPINNVHWAGTETAQDHPGYIEGAVQSGQRAAQEVFQALSRNVNAGD